MMLLPSGVHRPPEGQGRNGITRAQSRTPGGDHDSPSARGITIHDFITMFLSCCFFYFSSCLSITAKLISLL